MGATRQLRSDNKAQAICDYLSELALQKGPHAKLPTIRELCEQFATSRVTLDEVLAELEAQHVVYRKQGSGIYVSPLLHRKTICILLDASQLVTLGASPFWGMLWGLFAQEAQRRVLPKDEYHMFHMVVASDDEEHPLPEDVMAMILAGKVHGVLAMNLNDAAHLWLSKQQLPYVAFAGYGSSMVLLEERTLAELAVAHLVEQGCRKIGLWAASDGCGGEWKPSRWHTTPYFREALASHGVPFRPALVRDYLYPAHAFDRSTPISAQEQGYLLAMDVFGDPDMPKPDGVFITNDMMTDGVLAAFQALGIRIGENIKIATHANVGTMMSFNYIKGMTVIEYDPAEIVQAMFALLDTLFAGGQPVEQTILVSPKLRTTGSSHT